MPLRAACSCSSSTGTGHVKGESDTQSAHNSCKMEIHANIAAENGEPDGRELAVSDTTGREKHTTPYKETTSFCDAYDHNNTRITNTTTRLRQLHDNEVKQDAYDESVQRVLQTKSADEVEGKESNFNGDHNMVDDEGSVDQATIVVQHNSGSRDICERSSKAILIEHKKDNPVHMEEKDSQNSSSQLSDKRLLSGGSGIRLALQQLPECQKDTATSYFSADHSTKELSDNNTADSDQETALLTTCVVEDVISNTCSASTESPKPSEETPTKAINSFPKQLVSPKIRELQKVLGFISDDATEIDGGTTDMTKALNPFDKRAAQDVHKFGLLKTPPIGSHSFPFHGD
ncbi:uncharacterized protein LOC134187056 [Corticium candelabrum]|uniref:uncharacterized protein LOC134187056 n=1 Tax=Corticium candelabrum TaxID=121492 RepID=UPI002E2731DA|nr:uncharacterized protein LOC134187056 [Corticium candelabrum]